MDDSFSSEGDRMHLTYNAELEQSSKTLALKIMHIYGNDDNNDTHGYMFHNIIG